MAIETKSMTQEYLALAKKNGLRAGTCKSNTQKRDGKPWQKIGVEMHADGSVVFFHAYYAQEAMGDDDEAFGGDRLPMRMGLTRCESKFATDEDASPEALVLLAAATGN